MQIQQGYADGSGWWPLQHAAFAKAQEHYSQLHRTDRAAYTDQQGGHEVLAADGLAFFEQHLSIAGESNQ